MMRANPSASMQKTYDECFLTCSTAVYFESQNNEAEALRSWKSALDQIYYHNAYRVSSNYRPRSETEKALHDSLHQLELQCKERVDLLEALKNSREDAQDDGLASDNAPSHSGISGAPTSSQSLLGAQTVDSNVSSWLGGGTVPPVGYSDLSRPPLPYRPTLQARKSSGSESTRTNSHFQASNGHSLSPQPTNHERKSRTPSPDKRSRMLRTLRPGKDTSRPSSSKLPSSAKARPPAAAKAATQAWGANVNSTSGRSSLSGAISSKDSFGAYQTGSARSSFERPIVPRNSDTSTEIPRHEVSQSLAPTVFKAEDSIDNMPYSVQHAGKPVDNNVASKLLSSRRGAPFAPEEPSSEPRRTRPPQRPQPGVMTYRDEYASSVPDSRKPISSLSAVAGTQSRTRNHSNDTSGIEQHSLARNHARTQKPSAPLEEKDGKAAYTQTRQQPPQIRRAEGSETTVRAEIPSTTMTEAMEANTTEDEPDEWKERTGHILKNLPRGVDASAAQQILNEIVIHGDEVHWDDVAGLEIAKSALKETVVYPFLRPDLFMGLREPARGMLLFGPPGTGKTMLARAVATESRSTFFAISASSLTSKFLGESEKLVRALFALAKLLAPAIIFVDEIDSLLSSRSSSGEHEATRRIKTEFLIQWSDLAKAAAGREQTEKDKERGDASRVLVLAATNLPWAIDEAARRRFVRRQYIPLPEDYVRRKQLQSLLSHQKHEMDESEMDRLVVLTEGFSGSDITALAKDAAMGPLRSLGEKLLHMTMDEIRPIRFEDFQASLQTIRPSVSKQGLKEFEDWAREFGERGG